MARIRITLARAAIVSLVLAANIAWGQKVSIETDGAFDFARNRRYQWREHALAQKDPVMQAATVAREVIRSRVNEHLMAKGFQPVEGTPDFYVTYFASGNLTEDQRIKGHMVLDFVESGSGRVAWRAVCKDTIDDVRKRTDDITRWVDKAMRKFPPKPAAKGK